MPHRFLHPRFTLPIGATIAVITLLCATDTNEPRRTAEGSLDEVTTERSQFLTREQTFSVMPENDLDEVDREKDTYASTLRARIEALGNTAFAVDADQASNDDFEAWRDLQARRTRLEADLASLQIVTADEWPLLRENLDTELGVARRDMRTAARLPTITPR